MKQEKITLKNSKNQNLIGVLYKPENRERFPIAIFCHGYRSTKENIKVKPIAENLVRAGAGLFAFDFSGMGESEGKFEDTTISQYIDDLKCAIDRISLTTVKISVIGSSLGGLIALQEAAKDKRIKSLALISPVSHFPWGNKEEFSDIGKWKDKGYAFTNSRRFGKLRINYSFYEDGLKYGDISKYKQIRIPVLIIHGTKDKAVPIKDSIAITKLIYNSKLIKIDGADHMYTKPKDFENMVNSAYKFITDVLA